MEACCQWGCFERAWGGAVSSPSAFLEEPHPGCGLVPGAWPVGPP